MNNNYTYLKKIYNLKNKNIIDFSQDKIYIMFLCENKYYCLKNSKLVDYSLSIPLNVLEVIDSIEKIYKINIINYFPVCFLNESSILITCKIKKVNSLYMEELKKYNEILKLANEKAKYYNDEYDDETLVMEKYSKRYEIYDKYIKKYIITSKRRKKKELRELIKKLVGDAKSVIDVSCGDSCDIFKVCDDLDMVVGNDINLYQLKNDEKKFCNVIYTNDNILDFSFQENAFDVSFCKNTLHHMDNEREIKQLLNSVTKIAKKTIIIEIEDPKKTGKIPYLFNKYLYTKFLKDAGNYFITFSTFKKVIDSTLGNRCDINYFMFENILGKYMIALIEKR